MVPFAALGARHVLAAARDKDVDRAMETGISERVWSIEEVVTLIK
jgi:hypothetical protein